MIFEGVDLTDGPMFDVRDTAHCIFGVSSACLRSWDFLHQFDIGDDDLFVAQRSPKGRRVYSLADIERMVYGLLHNHVLSGETAGDTLIILASLGRLYGLIPNWQMEPE